MNKNNKKDYRIHRIIIFSCGVLLFLYMMISTIVKGEIEGNVPYLIISGIAVLLLGYCLIIELFPQLGGTKKTLHNPSMEDLNIQKKDVLDEYNDVASKSSFEYPLYGTIEISFESLEDNLSGAEVVFSNNEHQFELIIDLAKGVDINSFLANTELKKKIIDDYLKLDKENNDKLCKCVINQEYDYICEGLEFYLDENINTIYDIRNKTEEEIKKTLYDNYKLQTFSISLNANYEITYVSYMSRIGRLSMDVGVEVTNGLIKYDDIDTHLTV